MRPGDRTERQNQCNQRGASGHRIRQEGDRDVSRGKTSLSDAIRDRGNADGKTQQVPKATAPAAVVSAATEAVRSGLVARRRILSASAIVLRPTVPRCDRRRCLAQESVRIARTVHPPRRARVPVP